MFLRILFGISTNSYSGDEGRPFQGVVQGSSAAPALWIIISIFLIQYLYSKNLTSHLFMPFSGIIVFLATLIFVDDTDLYIFNCRVDTTEDLVYKV